MQRRCVEHRAPFIVNGVRVGEVVRVRCLRGLKIGIEGTGRIPAGIHVVEEIVRQQSDRYDATVNTNKLVFRGRRKLRFDAVRPTLTNTSDEIVNNPRCFPMERKKQTKEARNLATQSLENHGNVQDVTGCCIPDVIKVGKPYRTRTDISVIVFAATTSGETTRACLCILGGVTMPVTVNHVAQCDCATEPDCWCNKEKWGCVQMSPWLPPKCPQCGTSDKQCPTCALMRQHGDLIWVPFVSRDVF